MDEVIKDPRAHDGLRSFETVDGTFELYLEVRRPIQELVVVGAGHVAQPMAHMGALLGYRVTVLDDRPDFATRERFPEADRLVQADFSDPFAEVVLHERSHLLLVTRGHKYDYECLIRALRADPAPAYIGMIGSRRRVRATYVQLIAEGIDRTLIDRIHAPVGLDIGAETPEEIAVSVAAELVMLNRGGSGVPLKDVERVSERFFQNSRQDEDK
jgi:xanthine dehydrogenase accessory factor